MRSRTFGVVALLGIGFTACGGSATNTQAVPPQAPATPGSTQAPTEPRTLEEAEAALERARAELSSVALAGAPAPATAPAGAPDPAPPSAAPAPAEVESAREPAEEGESRDEGRAEERALSPCETACKAFGSLVRAKDAVCRLEEPRGARCDRAEGIVRDAQARVQGCACPY